MGQLRVMFKSPEMIAQTCQAARELDPGEPITERHVAESLRRLDPIWDELFPVEQLRIVQLLVENVTVNEDGLQIRLRSNGIHSLVSEMGGVMGEVIPGNRTGECVV